jgi:hypothetical protein
VFHFARGVDFDRMKFRPKFTLRTAAAAAGLVVLAQFALAIAHSASDKTGSFEAPAPRSAAFNLPARDLPVLRIREKPRQATFVYLDGIPERERATAEAAFALAVQYYEQAAGQKVGPFTVVVATSTESVLADLDPRFDYSREDLDRISAIWEACRALTLGTVIYLSPLGISLWDDHLGASGGLSVGATRSAVHELAHVLQYQLLGNASDRDLPTWLTEGSAELEVHLALDVFHDLDFVEAREVEFERARITDVLLGGREGADPLGPTPDEYTHGFLAADLATGERGPGALFHIWRLMGAGQSYEDAFTAVIGVSPADFAAAFEAHREKHFPPHTGGISGRLTIAGAPPAHEYYVWLCPSFGDSPDCHWTTTDTEGRFSLRLPDDNYAAQFWLADDDALADQQDAGEYIDHWYLVPGRTTPDFEDAGTLVVDGDWQEIEVDLAPP